MLVLSDLPDDYLFAVVNNGIGINVGLSFSNTKFEDGKANVIFIFADGDNQHLFRSLSDPNQKMPFFGDIGFVNFSSPPFSYDGKVRNDGYTFKGDTKFINNSAIKNNLRKFLNAHLENKLKDRFQIFIYQIEFYSNLKKAPKKIEYKEFELKISNDLIKYNEVLYLEAIPEFEKLVYKLMKHQPEVPRPQPIITDDIDDELKKLLDKVAEDDGQETTSVGPPPLQVFAKPIVGDIIQLGSEFGKVTLVENDTIEFETLTKTQASEILNQQFRELQNN